MRSATVYKFPDKFIIHSDSKTKAGFRIHSAPYFRVGIDANMETVIMHVMTAMDAAGEIVDTPDMKTNSEIYLAGMGLKSKKELYKNCVVCSIYEKDNLITFIPTVNQGAKGFLALPIDKNVILPSDASIADLAVALIEALSLCE